MNKVMKKETFKESNITEDTFSTEGDFKLRKYQIELADSAIKGQNCIICAPTGSGKTVTTGYICRWLIKQNPLIKIIFLVPIRSLANQQSEILGNMLDKTILSNPDVCLRELLTRTNVVILTHQILINNLDQKLIELNEIDLIIFDECHHTKLDHPYNQIMNNYHRKKIQDKNYKLPQIIGLTACLGTDNSSNESEILQHFAKLCARLDCCITVVEKNKAELLKYNSKPTIDQIISCRPRRDSYFYLELVSQMVGIEMLYEFPPLSMKGSVIYETEIIMMRKEYESVEGTLDMISICKTLELMNDALLIFNDCTEEYALEFLRNDMLFLEANKNLRKLKENILHVIEDLEIICCDDAWKTNQKLVNLCRLLQKMTESNATCVIITRTCRNANFLYNFLKKHESLKDNLYCLLLVGQTNEKFGMTESQQIQTISSFKKMAGKICSVLIATDIVLEGMDYPKCNSVIRYNFVSNEIGRVQSRGRARAPDSQIFLIVDENSINLEKEYKNMFRERKMMEVLECLPQIRVKFASSVLQEKANHLKNLKIEINKEETLKTINVETVSFHCKACKAEMCSGSSVRKCPAGYVTMDSAIVKMTQFVPWQRVMVFKLEEQLGDMICKHCRSKIGIRIKFKRNLESYACALKKDSLSWKKDLLYQEIPKKWNQLPFHIAPLLDK